MNESKMEVQNKNHVPVQGTSHTQQTPANPVTITPDVG
jgi:hypothetical protein